MMVGSNETRYGFMDEGFNEYIDAPALANIAGVPTNYADRYAGYRRVAGSELEAPMMWPSDYTGPNGGVAVYTKAPAALYALGAVVGDSAVRRAFANYAVQWKYKHPSPWDFFMSMNHSFGKDLGWFWNEWFFTTYTCDQSIESVTTAGADAEITVYDKSELVMPIVAKIDFTDGTSETVTSPAEVWFGGSRHATLNIPLRGRTVKRVILDPESRCEDVDRSNNLWPAN